MFNLQDVQQWMTNAPEIPADALTERDIINAREAWYIYFSWDRDGRRSEIERYWGNPQPRQQDLAELQRGFEVLSQYGIGETHRSTTSVPSLSNAVIETDMPAGYIAMSPAVRNVGLYPLKERRIIG